MQKWQIFAEEWHIYPFLSDIAKDLVMSANANNIANAQCERVVMIYVWCW